MKRKGLTAAAAIVLAACGLDLVGIEPGRAVPAEAGSSAEAGPRPSLDGAPRDATTCVDLANDAENCGECGHSCLGATCSEGLCTPTVLLRLGPDSHPHGLALGATVAYVAENKRGFLVGVTLATADAGRGFDVFDTTKAPRALALAGDRLYWPEQSRFASVTLIGENKVEQGINSGSAVVIDGEDVFYNNFDAKKIMVTNRVVDGAKTHEIQNEQAFSSGIAVDDKFVYWTHATNGESVSKRVRDIALPTIVIARDEDRPESIVVDSARLYWTTRKSIRTIALGSVDAPTTLYGAEKFPRSLLRDGNSLYWFEATAGTLRRGTTDGKAIVTLARNQQHEMEEGLSIHTAIAVDSQWVYWVSTGDGTLSRVAK